MIDIVYHNKTTEKVERTSKSKKRQTSEGELHSDNPAVRELLDHVAEELAKEYIRLMKETVAEPEQEED